MPDLPELDTRGLKCPLPVLRAEKYLAALASGDQFVLLADDPIARIDIPLMCTRAHHQCILEHHGDQFRFTITKSVD